MKLAKSLFQQGLIIVTIPLLFQIAFVVHLLLVLDNVRSNLDQEAQSYQLIRSAYTCFRKTAEHVAFTGLSLGMGKSTSSQTVRQYLEKVKTDSNSLAARIQSNKDQEKNARDLQAAAEKLVATVIPEIPPEEDPKTWSLKQSPSIRKLIESDVPDYLKILTRIVDVEENHSSADIAAANKSLDQLGGVLAIALLVPSLVAMVLARFYSVSITKPLQHLSNVGWLMSRRSPLPPIREDAAEFAEVDKLLHAVNEEVENALIKEKDVVANAVDLICSLDRDEVFRVVNPYVQRMLKYSEEEIVGRHLSELATGAGLVDAIAKMRTTMQSESAATFELRLRKKDLSYIDTKWSCVWSQAHHMFFCVVSDVTEQKRAEQLKQDFSDAVSQDLRNPLLAMRASIDLMLQGQCGPLSPEVAATLTKTSSSVNRLVLLASELLDFQKIEGGKMQLDTARCDLHEIAAESFDFVSILADSKDIKIIVPKGSAVALCDRMKILQTVVNLLTNAIKFSPANSSIEIVIREFAETVELSVIDCGPGIPDQYQRRIFEPFEQVPSAQSKVGTGLGLAICKLIVEAHGGSISVASNSENTTGSVFTISLPKIAAR